MKAKVLKFEDLIVWQNAMDLSVDIYRVLNGCKDYGLKDQICRASVSVPSNIAEGFERQYNKEFVQFLYYAKGSIAELRTQLVIAYKLKYIEKMIFEKLIERSRMISAQLFQLIKTRKEKFK
ncbi:four helix bundle protein [Prolixibacteraceae bacterium JC049]|nr:four helix bundle protein [Prolixibacteraceae bacterium JC049]